jgi:hypothetical protein
MIYEFVRKFEEEEVIPISVLIEEYIVEILESCI